MPQIVTEILFSLLPEHQIAHELGCFSALLELGHRALVYMVQSQSYIFFLLSPCKSVYKIIQCDFSCLYSRRKKKQSNYVTGPDRS